jgi:hypothetical protein
MKYVKIIKLPKGDVRVDCDGDIFMEIPNKEKMEYVGSLIDKDLDENGIIVSLKGEYVKKFVKALKRLV